MEITLGATITHEFLIEALIIKISKGYLIFEVNFDKSNLTI
jgi:hypothetical protein